jgi:hypothetical protein
MRVKELKEIINGLSDDCRIDFYVVPSYPDKFDAEEDERFDIPLLEGGEICTYMADDYDNPNIEIGFRIDSHNRFGYKINHNINKKQNYWEDEPKERANG